MGRRATCRSRLLFAGHRGDDIDTHRLEDILRQVQQGELSIAEAMGSLRTLPFEDLDFAKVDHHRELRTGFPEVVYAPGKTQRAACRNST